MRPRPTLVALAAALTLWGCQDQDYIDDGFYAFALTEDTAPFAATADAELFLVEQRIELPLREPTSDQLRVLRQGARDYPGLPFPRLPWARRHYYELEVDYVIYNLSDERVNVALVVNGFNEFHEYLPGVIFDDDDAIPEFSQWERFLVLEPQGRLFGTIREEELDEVAVDLATVVNGVANPNQTVHFQNHSSTDTRSQPFIPAVVPALTGIRLGLRSEEAANVVVEATVRARDLEDRIVGRNEAWRLPVPELFAPSSVTGGVAP